MELEGAFFNTSDYEMTEKKLGEGAFGKVYLVENIEEKKKYAAKIINVQNVFTGKEQMLLIRESSILHKLNHPAIVKFYGINFHSFDDPDKLEPTILTEYLSKGSLKEILKKERHGLADHDWNATKKYICLLGIADAMRYLHKQGILHRDLKLENILIDDEYYPRICDFGLSRCFSQSLSKSIKLTMTGKIGTPIYMAPELFEDEENYGQGIDVYSFAIMAYEIVSGIEPYSEKNKSISLSKLVKKVLSGGRPEFVGGITEPMKELLSSCWSQDINKRPTFDEIFDKLKSDFSYIDEDVDKEEINNYLSYLKEGSKNEKSKEDTLQQVQIQLEEKQNEYNKLIGRESRRQNDYFAMIKDLVLFDGKVEKVYFGFSEKNNILHEACNLGNLNLVKYLISLDVFDILSTNIFFIFFS